MARIGLTLYLMLATTAGPWLCCCTAGRLPVFAATNHEPPSNGGCCGHHDGCPDPSDTKQDQSPQSPSPTPDAPCPCKSGHRAPSILSAPENSSVAELGRSLNANPMEGVWLTVAISPQVLDAPDQAAKEPTVWPFYSPRDILRALHILRC